MVGVHGPAGLRTVLPTRTTGFKVPPTSGISDSVTSRTGCVFAFLGVGPVAGEVHDPILHEAEPSDKMTPTFDLFI